MKTKNTNTLNWGGMPQSQLSALYLETVGYDPFTKQNKGANRQEVANTLEEFERTGDLRKPKPFLEFALKGINFNERMSEETNCFSAYLYVNGRRIATVQNQGHGGPTDISPIGKEEAKLVKSAEEYCATLPPYESEFTGKPIAIDLEFLVDQMVEAFLQRKDEEKAKRKVEKLMLNHIVVGIRANGWFQNYRTWKTKVPLSVLAHYPDKLNPLLDSIRKQLQGDQEILNNNLSVNPKVN